MEPKESEIRPLHCQICQECLREILAAFKTNIHKRIEPCKHGNIQINCHSCLEFIVNESAFYYGLFIKKEAEVERLKLCLDEGWDKIPTAARLASIDILKSRLEKKDRIIANVIAEIEIALLGVKLSAGDDNEETRVNNLKKAGGHLETALRFAKESQ